MNKPVVYLAGPIANTAQGVAFEWRDDAIIALNERGILALSPLRAKRALVHDSIGDSFHKYPKGAFYTPDGILARDHGDVINCDAILMNLLGATSMSFGTGMELAWAFDRHIRTVVAIEPEGNVHDGHPMFNAAVKFRVPTLDEAIDAVAIILGR